MLKEFEADRYDLVDADRVHRPGHTVGGKWRGDLDVWTTRGENGTAFVRQITEHGVGGPLRQGVYGTACFFLKERASGHFFFLEKDVRGYYLHSEDFFGARTYFGDQATRVETWLAGRSPARPIENGHAPESR